VPRSIHDSLAIVESVVQCRDVPIPPPLTPRRAYRGQGCGQDRSATNVRAPGVLIGNESLCCAPPERQPSLFSIDPARGHEIFGIRRVQGLADPALARSCQVNPPASAQRRSDRNPRPDAHRHARAVLPRRGTAAPCRPVQSRAARLLDLLAHPRVIRLNAFARKACFHRRSRALSMKKRASTCGIRLPMTTASPRISGLAILEHPHTNIAGPKRRCPVRCPAFEQSAWRTRFPTPIR